MINFDQSDSTSILDVAHLQRKLSAIGGFIGKTPLRKLQSDQLRLYVKLEYQNFSGSIKDRPAFSIIKNGIEAGLITPRTTIVESSSGNFAIALASMCKFLGLRSTIVIDPNINPDNELVLRVLADEVIKVTERDLTGGFLLTRINKVREYCCANPHSYWTNQYANEHNYWAYYHGLAEELCREFTQLDYIFIGVSSGGTITGLSLRLKERYPQVTIVAVDIIGSVIFGQPPSKRNISGLGSSIKPEILKFAQIDHVLHVSELEIINGCNNLLQEQGILGGGSTGAMYAAIQKYFVGKSLPSKPNVVFLCPDKGSSYLDTIFNKQWVAEKTLNTN